MMHVSPPCLLFSTAIVLAFQTAVAVYKIYGRSHNSEHLSFITSNTFFVPNSAVVGAQKIVCVNHVDFSSSLSIKWTLVFHFFRICLQKSIQLCESLCSSHQLVSSYQICSNSKQNIFCVNPAAFSSSLYITSTLSRSLGPRRSATVSMKWKPPHFLCPTCCASPR